METDNEDTFSTSANHLHDHSQLFHVIPTAWDQICTLLLKKLGHDNYTRCFSGTTATITGDNRVIIHVPNPIHQLWIESNFSGL